MSFQVPYDYSSSPPSTPARSSNGKNIFGQSNNPSTTPAGLPPSSAGSFTPSGPPPSSFLGSSMMGDTPPIKPISFGTQPNIFKSQQNSFEPGSSLFSTSIQSPAPPPRRSGLNTEYRPSPVRGFQAPDSEAEEGDSVEYLDEDDSYNGGLGRSYATQDSRMDEEERYDDDDMDDYRSELPASKRNGHGYDQRNNDMQLSTIGAFKRSQNDTILGDSTPDKKRAPIFTKIAKDLYSPMCSPKLVESDDIVLGTESIITRLYEEGVEIFDNKELQGTLMEVSQDLTILWEEYRNKTDIPSEGEQAATIGPGPDASDFSRASALASLALQIHHPSPAAGQQSATMAQAFKPKSAPLPRTVAEWLFKCHSPYSSQVMDLKMQAQGPASHRFFWDILLNTLLRGQVSEVIDLLETANWKYARPGLDESREDFDVGYTGRTLANINAVVNEVAVVLRQCPAVHGDFDVRSSDWTLFRLKVSGGLEQLRSFVEGRKTDHNDEPNEFGRSSIRDIAGTRSTNAKKPESPLPWNIFQYLVSLYNIAMGEMSAIVENALDWCEATVGLFIWWDEGKDDRRLTLGRSHALIRPSSKESDREVYLHKLHRSFLIATSDNTDFQVNTLSPFEVGLASLFEGDAEAVIGFLKGWSGPVSSAVAEVATIGGWLPHTEPQDLMMMGSLDQDDLDLLGINPAATRADGVKDQTLIAYARSLSQRGNFESTGSSTTLEPLPSREGWEIAIAVLGRLDSASRSEEMVGDFLKDFDLDSSIAVDKLWVLLNDIGMGSHAEKTAETYADLLAEDSHNYGEAMWYYALSHKTEKVKDVLDLLISFSLVQSTAFPPTADLDDHLQRLLSTPKKTLLELSQMDVEAAELLHNFLSGYATLRKFYDLRDQEILCNGNKSQSGAAIRRVEAAKALLAVITSSDDNIRGGLYDEARGAVVSVDFLLALLGEAMVFVNQPDSIISVSQIEILLRAIEDLQSVGPRVYTACAEFLQTVLASAQGLKGSTPSDMLRKSTSNVSGTSSFSMVGSSMLASQLKQSMSSSGVLVKGNIKRGWDWRHGVSAGTSGDEVLKILRLGLAKDLAKAWLREADGTL